MAKTKILAAPFVFDIHVIIMMIIVVEPCYEVMNHYDPSYVFLHIAISLSLSLSNGVSYLWQMVRTHTGDFASDVPE
jgi:hypothetical protein